MKKLAINLLLASAFLASPASAHRSWLLPSATVFSTTDAWVTVDSAISNDLFYFEHQPGRLEGLKIWQPDGSAAQAENSATGRYRSVFDVHVNKPGTWKIGTESGSVSGTFKANGVEGRVGRARGPQRPDAPAPITVADVPANATDVKLTESIGRNMIYVTNGATSTTVLKPSGKGLEFDPITHPNDLVAGEDARFRFLVDGKPIAGLKVSVIPGGKRYRDNENAMELVTDKDGVLTISWPQPGMYWLNTSMTDTKSTIPRVTDRRLSFTSTLEVLAP